MKKSRYANIIRKGDERLIHNTLMGGIVKASCVNSKAFLDKIDEESSFEIDDNEKFHQTLIEMRMIVADDVDESNLANLYFEISKRRELFIILFVTKQCNFRCVYCSQKHENKRMSHETYAGVLNAIEGFIDNYGYKSVNVSFFGGEPLLEYDAVCNFSSQMIELAERKNVAYVAGMTTNGYLLTPTRLENLVNLKIINYQITLDGLQEQHDNVRFLTGNGRTWETIMKNLISATSSDIGYSFMLRTNLDDDVMLNATEFIAHLTEHFKDDSRFTFHFETVKNLDGSPDIDFDLIEDEIDCVHKISSAANKVGLRVFSSEVMIRPLGMACYATSSDSFCIDYDGTLMKCTVHVDNARNRIGTISDNMTSITDHLLAQWTSFGLTERCKTCKILPICYNKKCPFTNPDDDPCNRLLSMYENTLEMLI